MQKHCVGIGIAEILWILKLIVELGFPQDKASQLHYDNGAAINISENQVQHDRTNHVEVDRHFMKENL